MPKIIKKENKLVKPAAKPEVKKAAAKKTVAKKPVAKAASAKEVIFRKELVDIVAAKILMPKVQIDKVILEVLDAVAELVAAGKSVAFQTFGRFSSRKRAPRKGFNPQTRKSVDVPAMTLPCFKASAAFKQQVRSSKRK